MKKILTIMLTTLLLINFSLTICADEIEVNITNVVPSSSEVVINGEAEGAVAVAIQIVKKDDPTKTILAMQSFEVEDDEFTATIEMEIEANEEYTVKVANFEGGKWAKEDFTYVPPTPRPVPTTPYVVPNTGIK